MIKEFPEFPSLGMKQFRRFSTGGNLHQLDDKTMTEFVTKRGVTVEDVATAMELISSDGRRITKEDVKVFLESHFSKLSSKHQKFVSQWKEDITKEALTNILLNKPISSIPFAEAMEWFNPDPNHGLDPIRMPFLFQSKSLDHVAAKTDYKALLERFDYDKDGKVELEDFKRMSLL